MSSKLLLAAASALLLAAGCGDSKPTGDVRALLDGPTTELERRLHDEELTARIAEAEAKKQRTEAEKPGSFSRPRKYSAFDLLRTINGLTSEERLKLTDDMFEVTATVMSEPEASASELIFNPILMSRPYDKVSCRFDDAYFRQSRLSELKAGDRVTVRGSFSYVDDDIINLSRCELVGENPVLTRPFVETVEVNANTAVLVAGGQLSVGVRDFDWGGARARITVGGKRIDSWMSAGDEEEVSGDPSYLLTLLGLYYRPDTQEYFCKLHIRAKKAASGATSFMNNPKSDQPTERPAPNADAMRRWVDATGRYRVDAQLVSSDSRSVQLRTRDGRDITVPVGRLSTGDIVYLQGAGAAGLVPKAAQPPPTNEDAALEGEVKKGNERISVLSANLLAANDRIAALSAGLAAADRRAVEAQAQCSTAVAKLADLSEAASRYMKVVEELERLRRQTKSKPTSDPRPTPVKDPFGESPDIESTEAYKPSVDARLSGRWRNATGYEFSLVDDGNTAVIRWVSNSSQAFAGDLSRDYTGADHLSGNITSTFAPGKRFELGFTAVIIDADHLRVSCREWPRFSTSGRETGTRERTEDWTRVAR